MPELPEVETIVSELRPRLEGRKVTAVTVLSESSVMKMSPAAFERELSGQTIERLWRRGKHIIMDLSSGNHLVVHLRMTGRLLLRDVLEPEDRFTRVIIRLDGGRELRFADARKFGRMSLLSAEQLQQLGASLGPEPLSEEFTLDSFKGIIDKRGQRIKPLLLDQRYLVGLGNIYVDESLFEAGIHPARPASSLNEDEIQRLFLAIKHVLSEGIADKGTTFDSYLDAFGKRGGHQFNLNVYRRTGEACPRCGALIERIVVGGRGTHFCSKCQPLTSSPALETVPPLRTGPRRRG